MSKKLKHIKHFESVKTECQTPDAIFKIKIKDKKVECVVDLPFDLELSEKEAKELEVNIHNSIEIVLSKYFDKK